MAEQPGREPGGGEPREQGPSGGEPGERRVARAYGPPPVGSEPAARRGLRRRDWAIGIAIGLVIGIAAVIIFVFVGSEGTIDAPSLETDEPARERPRPQEPAP